MVTGNFCWRWAIKFLFSVGFSFVFIVVFIDNVGCFAAYSVPINSAFCSVVVLFCRRCWHCYFYRFRSSKKNALKGFISEN